MPRGSRFRHGRTPGFWVFGFPHALSSKAEFIQSSGASRASKFSCANNCRLVRVMSCRIPGCRRHFQVASVWMRTRPYDEIDLARWLVPGRNVLAVRAYNPGYSNFQYLTEGYAGLLVAATWGRVRIQTDATWKCLRQPGIRHDMTRTSLQLFAQENFDAREAPLDWMNSAFDDSAWGNPKTQKPGVLPWRNLE